MSALVIWWSVVACNREV